MFNHVLAENSEMDEDIQELRELMQPLQENICRDLDQQQELQYLEHAMRKLVKR